MDSKYEIHLTRKRGIKRLSMRIKPDCSIAITCPWYVTDKEVATFVESNTDWIEKHQKKVSERRETYLVGQTLSTRFHSIDIVSIENGKTRAAIKAFKVVITISNDDDIGSDSIQQFIKKVITEICRKEAQQMLPPRVHKLALENNFSFNKVFIKNLKSKWGSCSTNGNINLNLRLVRLPDHLIDYIILHELCHTHHMNHGAGFWSLLNKITNGKAAQLDSEMKRYNNII